MDSENIHDKRPEIVLQPYNASAANYKYHGPGDDKLAILVCRIRTWHAEAPNWFTAHNSDDSCLTIRECESIEVTNSYKELISKAVIRFPRGTVVAKRHPDNTLQDNGKVDNKAVYDTTKAVTHNGDFVSYYQQDQGNLSPIKGGSAQNQYQAVKSMVSLDGSREQVGLTNMNAHLDEKYLLDANDFVAENRIEIYCGYAYSDKEFKEMMKDEKNVPDNMEMVFTGFITKCSVSTPLEIECENMAHVFTTINVPDITEKGKTTLKDFLDPKGKYRLLEGTGIELALGKSNFEIEVRGFHISSQLTVADVLHQWQESAIMCMMTNEADGTSKLKVGKNFYVDGGMGGLPVAKKDYITYTDRKTYLVIQFDWDVAEDKLELKSTDKKFLAIKAQGTDIKSKKPFGFTIRRVNGKGDGFEVSGDDGTSWQIVNEKKIAPKARRKKKDGTLGKQPKGYRTVNMNKVRTNDYNVVPYIKIQPCTKEELLKEAKEYWRNYVPNGVSGSLVIFGDLQVEPADIVALIDPRQPIKNGWYMVQDVNITFGTNGYRKELKIPYKVADFKKIPMIIL